MQVAVLSGSWDVVTSIEGSIPGGRVARLSVSPSSSITKPSTATMSWNLSRSRTADPSVEAQVRSRHCCACHVPQPPQPSRPTLLTANR